MMMGWVPDAKLGYVTDIWTPGPPLPAKPNPGLMAVVNTVKAAGLQPERFAGGQRRDGGLRLAYAARRAVERFSNTILPPR